MGGVPYTGGPPVNSLGEYIWGCTYGMLMAIILTKTGGEKMARNAKVIIMMDERVKERLQGYADQLGMTLSGLGAYILGHWVYQQDKMVNPFIERMKDELVQIAGEGMKDALEQLNEAGRSVP